MRKKSRPQYPSSQLKLSLINSASLLVFENIAFALDSQFNVFFQRLECSDTSLDAPVPVGMLRHQLGCSDTNWDAPVLTTKKKSAAALQANFVNLDDCVYNS